MLKSHLNCYPYDWSTILQNQEAEMYFFSSKQLLPSGTAELIARIGLRQVMHVTWMPIL